MATTPKKANTAVSAAITGPLLTLTFANGRTLKLDSNALTPDIIQSAIMHGLKQKLIDAAAIGRNPDTGATATIDDKFNAVNEIFQRITGDAPTWNKIRVGGEGGNKGGLLVRAMMRLTSKARDTITEYLNGLSKEEVAALRKNPRVVEVIAQLQAEQANDSGVDSDALLDGLMDGGDDNDTE